MSNHQQRKLKRIITDFDGVDATRLGWLVLAAAELSQHRYTLLRYSGATRAWKVNVRFGHRVGCQCGQCPPRQEHTSISETSPVEAYVQAVHWLMTAHAQAGAQEHELAKVTRVLKYMVRTEKFHE